MGKKKKRNSSLGGVSAKDLFPGLVDDGQEQAESNSSVPPPPPPDTSWLDDGVTPEEPDKSDFLISALIVLSSKEEIELVKRLLTEMSYLVDVAQSPVQALERLEESRYSLVICSESIAAEGPHEKICTLPSPRRREMYYVLVGRQLHTLFDLEAFSLSANMVVNSKDIKYLKAILKKGFEDYEKLFRPLIETINSTDGSLL